MGLKPTYEELEKKLREVEDTESVRKVAENMLLNEKRFSDSIIESLPGIFYLFDSAGKFIRWNKNFEEISEYSFQEIADMSPLDYFQGEDKIIIEDKISEVFTEGQVTVEAIFISKSGVSRPYFFTGKKLIIDDKPYLAGMGIDLTQKKQAEEALAVSEAQYRSFFENNHTAMLLINPESGDIVDANPAAVSYYGYSQKKFKRLKITDINTLSRDEVFKEMNLAKNENRNYFNFRHRLANGEIREVEVYSGPITVRNMTFLYSVIHDITERKLAAAEKERLISELKQALSEVKTLRGLIPICAHCKNIRDDKGYWKQIETYISDHSEAAFSHGICPDCMEELYPQLADQIKKRKDR